MLVVDISINRKRHVSSVGATRISPVDNIDNDTICKYKVGRIFDGKIKRPIGEVEHRYGDGAEVLAFKILELVSLSGISAIEEENYERLLSIHEQENMN
jgi:hypothetical protein